MSCRFSLESNGLKTPPKENERPTGERSPVKRSLFNPITPYILTEEDGDDESKVKRV